MGGELDTLLAKSRTRLRLPEPAIRRLLRERARLSQADVAAVVGVDRASVARWELGSREPRGDLLDAYVEILDRLATAGSEPQTRG
jgi:transcriptional regulator with XRE-family HTH domain